MSPVTPLTESSLAFVWADQRGRAEEQGRGLCGEREGWGGRVRRFAGQLWSGDSVPLLDQWLGEKVPLLGGVLSEQGAGNGPARQHGGSIWKQQQQQQQQGKQDVPYLLYSNTTVGFMAGIYEKYNLWFWLLIVN